MRRFLRIWHLGVVGVAVFCGTFGWALEWVSTSYEGTVAPLQRTLDVAFSFKNAGPQPVTIRDLQTNCDCLEAAPDRLVYQSGESGLITARFTVGERLGLYERFVTVVTDDGFPPQRLIVRIDVPDFATTEPQSLDWKVGEAMAEKSVEVKPATGLPIIFDAVMVSNTDFVARLETVTNGTHYRVHITPTQNLAPGNAAVRIKGSTVTGDKVVVSAYANIQ